MDLQMGQATTAVPHVEVDEMLEEKVQVAAAQRNAGM